MPVNFIVTDITNMTHGNICIGGVVNHDINVRPIRAGRIPQDWCNRGRHHIRPFSEIALKFENQLIEPPHTEDRWIDPDFCKFRRILTEAEIEELMVSLNDGKLANIFGAPIRYADDQQASYILKGEGYRSLGTIKPQEIIEFHYCQSRYNEEFDSRLTFTDDEETKFRIKIKDITFQTYLEYLRICENMDCNEVEQRVADTIFRDFGGYLRIGLARGWGKYPNRCYLQITGVYPLPDYTNGRSFLEMKREILNNEEDVIPF